MINMMCHTVMDLFRCHQTNARMMMFFVVPIERMTDRNSWHLGLIRTSRETRGQYFQGLELGLRSKGCHCSHEAGYGFWLRPDQQEAAPPPLDFMLDPRSACTVSCPGSMFCFMQALFNKPFSQGSTVLGEQPSSRRHNG